MGVDVIVAGGGYAGTAVVTALSGDATIDLRWISATPEHEVKHEIHRIIRSPGIAEGLAIPRFRIAGDDVVVEDGRVVAVDPQERRVTLADGDTRPYDYLVLTVGARTAFYGIPGLREHAHTLECIADAQRIRRALEDAPGDRVVVGGGGLSGVQTAGELAAMPDRDLEITLIEALDSVLPAGPPGLRSILHEALTDCGVAVRTDSPIVEVTPGEVRVADDDVVPADLVIWTGGITGRPIDHGDTIAEERGRIAAEATLRTSDPHIFALGDAAAIAQPDGIAPASAQAAWQAAPVAAANLRQVIEGDRPRPWTHNDRGTLVSVGERAFAHGVSGVPVDTFGPPLAPRLKKLVAIRWIADVASYRHALSLWPAL